MVQVSLTRSPSILSERAAEFRDYPDFKDAVIQLAGYRDGLISEGSTWVLKSELEAGSRLQSKQTSRLIAQLDLLTAWQAKLHICQIVRYLDVPEAARDPRRRWLAALLDAERPFLRAWALDALCHLPDTTVETFLETMESDPAASVRARVRKLKERRIP